ncbi:stage II sporulation protein R [Bacillus seohaeanensis]|uniref:Stage II sporulation protein R n=1 Tax=Bacillus seohaeanensis TaxID=284580 RepID=A0ABW5RRL6_9BACI
MKMKNLVSMYIIILSIGTILSLYIPKQELAAQETITIPDEAIRLRILANSDMEKDQEVKRLVRDEVNKEITSWVENLTSLDDARNIIKSRLPELQQIAVDVVEREGVDQTVSIDFGSVQFPTKLYGQFLYPAGEYEAVLITLGEGEGANWWCVLYPPLCFLDFSNGNAVRSPGFEEKAEASGKEESAELVEKEKEEKEIAAVAEVVPAEVEVEEQQETQQQKQQKKQREVNKEEVSPVEKKEVTESKHVDKTTTVEKSEPVYVEEKTEEKEEVEVRFFVFDVVKGLFD